MLQSASRPKPPSFFFIPPLLSRCLPSRFVLLTERLEHANLTGEVKEIDRVATNRKGHRLLSHVLSVKLTPDTA